MDGAVIDRNVVQSRVDKVVRLKEFWLCLAPIAALLVPVKLAAAVERGAWEACNGDFVTSDCDERTSPF